jgi:hypothetical protein
VNRNGFRFCTRQFPWRLPWRLSRHAMARLVRRDGGPGISHDVTVRRGGVRSVSYTVRATDKCYFDGSSEESMRRSCHFNLNSCQAFLLRGKIYGTYNSTICILHCDQIVCRVIGFLRNSIWIWCSVEVLQGKYYLRWNLPDNVLV